MNLTDWKGRLKNRLPKPSLRFYLIVIVTLFCLSGLALSVAHSQAVEPLVTAREVTDNPIPYPRPKSLALPQGFVQGGKPAQVSEVELVTITPDGFEPTAITRPPGRFVIAYDNRSGLGGLRVQLSDQSTNLVHQVTVPLLKNAWVGEFNLPGGKYFITEPAHPGWRCVLTIN